MTTQLLVISLISATCHLAPANDRFVTTTGTATIARLPQASGETVTISVHTEWGPDQSQLGTARDQIIADLVEFIRGAYPGDATKVHVTSKGLSVGPHNIGSRGIGKLSVVLPAKADISILEGHAETHSGINIVDRMKVINSETTNPFDSGSYLARPLSDAMAAARAKAEYIATMNRASLGDLVEMSEETKFDEIAAPSSEIVDGVEMRVPADPFKMHVTVKVTAKFILEKKND